MEYIELEVVDIKNSDAPSEAFALVLKEKEGKRYLPVIIGISEAKSIVLILNKIKTRRPSTHELCRQIILATQSSIESVVIYRYKDGIFYSHIVLKSAHETLKLDSRTSDAVAMALLSQAPIYIDSDIFEQVLQDVENEMDNASDLEFDDVMDDEMYDNLILQKLKEMTMTELDNLLDGAVQSEDFELATKIHEEILRRKV